MNATEYCDSHWIAKQVYKNLRSKRHQQRFDVIAESLKQCTGKRFADVGCGCGHSTVALAKRVKGDWLGIDFAESVIIEGKKIFPDFPLAYCDDIQNIKSFGTFSGVVCSEVIEHVEDSKAFIGYLWEITEDVLVLTTPHIRIVDPGHLRLYDLETIRRDMGEIPYVVKVVGDFFYIVAKREWNK